MNFFSYFFKPKQMGTGALIDIRSNTEKAKDVNFKEIVATADPVQWIEKTKEQWRKFPIFDQDGSGSCVAQTIAKLLGILYYLKNGIYVHFSATHVYQRRSNKPRAGMDAINAFNIASTGVTLEELVPSQNMTDTQMDNIDIPNYKEQVGEIFKTSQPIIAPIQDIETIASIIQRTKKGVMVWYYFQTNEWTDVPTIKNNDLLLAAPTTARHSVTAVDYILYQGKKALIIEDSWGTSYGMNGQRIITEDFHNKRNWFAAHTMNFKFDEKIDQTKPIHTFNKDLEFGMTDPEIIILQDILKYELLFPTNVSSTGYYGAITKTAVGKFQEKYNVTNSTSSGYGRTGPKTRKMLNSIYGK